MQIALLSAGTFQVSSLLGNSNRMISALRIFFSKASCLAAASFCLICSCESGSMGYLCCIMAIGATLEINVVCNVNKPTTKKLVSLLVTRYSLFVTRYMDNP